MEGILELIVQMAFADMQQAPGEQKLRGPLRDEKKLGA